MSHDCCVTLPHDAMGLSAVCDCGSPDHTHLLFLNMHAHCNIIGLSNMTMDTEIPLIYISGQPRLGLSCILINYNIIQILRSQRQLPL